MNAKTKNDVAAQIFSKYAKAQETPGFSLENAAFKCMSREDVAECLGVDSCSVSFAYFVAVADLVSDLETHGATL